MVEWLPWLVAQGTVAKVGEPGVGDTWEQLLGQFPASPVVVRGGLRNSILQPPRLHVNTWLR